MNKAKLKLVSSQPKPVIKGSLRPFRLYVGAQALAHRCYGSSLNAHKALLRKA